MAKTTSSKSQPAKTQTYSGYKSAIAGAIKRGEPSITFKLPGGNSKPKAK